MSSHAHLDGPPFAVVLGMHHRFDSRLAVTLAAILAFAAVACSAAPAPTLSERSNDVKGKTPAKSADSDTPATNTDPTTPTPTPATPTPADGECGKKADGDACFECCYQKSPAEIDRVDAVFAACICEAPGACKADCADSFCGADPNKAPSAACEACITTSSPTCGEEADAACQASAGCKAVEACAKSECAAFDKAP